MGGYLKLGASAAAIEFCEWVQVGIGFHGFQLLVLLPYRDFSKQFGLPPFME